MIQRVYISLKAIDYVTDPGSPRTTNVRRHDREVNFANNIMMARAQCSNCSLDTNSNA